MKCIDEVPAADLKGKRVIVRSDFNVPLDKNGTASDIFRLKRGWATISLLVKAGARVVVLSHIGRDPEESLAPVAEALKQFGKVVYVPDLLGAAAHAAAAAMGDGDVLLLENLRKDPRETENDAEFAHELAAYGEMYVGDAFAAAHRAHASIVGIPKILPHYCGLLMRDEVAALSAARTPQSPSFAILGGAKFETKAPLILKLLEAYDKLFLTGALANDVFKARGLEVGISKVSAELPGADVLNHPNFIAPIDVLAETPDKHAYVKKPDAITKDEKMVDIGPDTIALLAPMIEPSSFILWNGPTGLYEDGYTHFTQALAEVVAHAVSRGAKAVIGGGDTIAAIEESGFDTSRLGFLSTGGGAMLEYLLQGSLPGIDALQ
ncbi:MAG TPA: phosphoglycerate kinase [Candidatus Paceibacterota bacterium]|nr:phosphoglycerate kinase [Candidatus Paceibacterota bacterium]